MPIVFDDIERDYDGPAKLGERQFSYLDRSSRVEAARVRGLIEDWISRYPGGHRIALAQRLRSTIDSSHYSAFFELTLHELLIRTNHDILAVEPTVPNVPYQPDFLVRSSDGTSFYLEVVTSMNETPEDTAAETRLNEAMRIVDEADAQLHFLDLAIEGKPARPVTLRRLRRYLADWIAGLPATEAVKDSPAFVYEEHGMKITTTAFLRKTPRRGNNGAIGGLCAEAYWSSPGGGIRESVEKKASRYGDLGAPYVVAVNAMADYRNEEDTIDAMFGSPCLEILTYDDGRIERRENRSGDGVWRGHHGPRKKGLSAIISTERLTPWSVGQRRARLLHNPWATNPLPTVPLSIDELKFENGHLEKLSGQTFSEIFDLPKEWPEA